MIPTRTVPIGDPAALARAIDSAMSAIPTGQHGKVILQLTPDRQTLAVAFKIGKNVSTLLRIEKQRGMPVGADFQASVNFAVQQPREPFTRKELYDVLRWHEYGMLFAMHDAWRMHRKPGAEVVWRKGSFVQWPVGDDPKL